ncbi:MAG: hypothetical protein HY289_05325 [Planctomycetes bacterium]|nr:hypothetical protein [Planctomycetota bacterium]
MGFLPWRSLSVLILAGVALTGCNNQQKDKGLTTYPKAAPPGGQVQQQPAGQTQFPTQPAGGLSNIQKPPAPSPFGQPTGPGTPLQPGGQSFTPGGAGGIPKFDPLPKAPTTGGLSPMPYTPVVPSPQPGEFAGDRGPILPGGLQGTPPITIPAPEKFR